MNDPMRPRDHLRPWSTNGSVSVRLAIGLMVVILGVLFLASNLQILDITSPMRYFWAAAFSAIGIALLIERRTERSWQWGVAWIIAGLWTFAYQARWIDVGFWQVIFPLMMLVLGASLVKRALNERYDASNPNSAGSVVNAVGVFSSCEQRPTTLERADLVATMGGVKLDLFQTQLVNNTAIIHVTAIMGGIEILVPSEWIVQSRVVPIMGAFVDKRRPATIIPVPEQAKTLIIDGTVVMGGIEVKN